MMIDVQIVIILAVACLSVAYVLNKYWFKWGLAFLGMSVVLGLWVFLGNLAPFVCSDISYHPVEQKRLPDGNFVDIVTVQDDAGIPHEVNINSTLGIKVPTSDKKFQIVRMRFNKTSLGLLFNSRKSEYQLIEIDK